jgi:photosystem II stability/assembly factor-like uncharacterized protein
LLVACLLAASTGVVGAAESQSTDTADWLDTALTSPTQRLFTPTSGALLALTSDGLMRSDDAGDDWYAVAPGHNVVYVDPNTQDTLYGSSQTDVLQRSTDGGATWSTIMDGQTFANKTVDALAASPANSDLLYVGLKLHGISDEYWLYRSQDAGHTWTLLFHMQNTLCGWGAQFIAPHPTDPSRLIFSGGCHAGRDFFEKVQQSHDQGQTFADWYANAQATADAPAGFPRALVGGQGLAPQRWYLAINRDQRLGGSVLLRSDDDGASWDTALDFQGGGTFDTDKSNFSVAIAALAYDPSNPDTVYVARTGAFPGFPPTVVTSGITTSSDGGQSWNDLGNQQMGNIADLALGIDGRYLFAATDHGVARLALQ